ncbi:MAG TPA: hypothetical protein VGM27_24715, partial [Acidobacteriaceae bacterium]
SLAPAISIHAYSPPLSEMNEYELDGSRLIPRERVSERAETLDEQGRTRRREPVERTRASSIEQVLSAARARLRRLSPHEAYEAMAKTEAILVDIRPECQRAIEGSIPGALVVEHNVLEWRFDPASSSRLGVNSDLKIVVSANVHGGAAFEQHFFRLNGSSLLLPSRGRLRFHEKNTFNGIGGKYLEGSLATDYCASVAPQSRNLCTSPYGFCADPSPAT